jgi:hypothetical protein
MINNRKKNLIGKHCKKKIHHMSAPFQTFFIGGCSGEGSKGGSPFFGKFIKIMWKLWKMRLLLHFFIFWNPFLNCLDPSLYKNKTKQNKAKNIDLLNVHLKSEQFIGRKILCHIQHIFLLTLFSSFELYLWQYG